MNNTHEKKQKKQICVGILAHVDAGKTTLSEAMLFTSGSIRKLGRVDNRDAFLDTYALERSRGITIFSKQAEFALPFTQVTLLDTPGHVDFSAEMERTLQVLDYAVLVVSGADGVQGHTQTLWRLLDRYQIPVFLFVNKMDQSGTDRDALLAELKTRLDDSCIDFSSERGEAFQEEIAMCEEGVLGRFLETGEVKDEEISRLIAHRKVFPCYFGSALKLSGVEQFMDGLDEFTCSPDYGAAFGAKVFKIARDAQGNRLTYMKITGGSLKVKATLKGRGKAEGVQAGEGDGDWEEKVNQIRIYSGEKYETVSEAPAGCICAVTGLTKTRPGEGLGEEEASAMPVLEPVLTYQIELPQEVSASSMLHKLRQLEEEEPELHIIWDETLQEIQAQIMGEVQIEVLKSLIKERFGVLVEFGSGNIVYKETIADRVEGVGHFEPLRHYAEVHLLLEPGEPGSGMQFAAQVSEDELDRNWQRLILTHLEEKEHRGVLTGSAVTDMRITLTAGRAHKKHTEGGDFRQATYRAVRQGLMQAKSVLLEPCYDFCLEVPEKMIGRAMSDLEKMNAAFELPQTEGDMAVLTGSVPVAAVRDYQKEVTAYTKGRGRLFCTFQGYVPCKNQEEIVNRLGYDPERDLENPTGSVFCAHGAGFIVSWDKVREYMHLESCLEPERREEEKAWLPSSASGEAQEHWIDTEEIDKILSKTFYSNKKEGSGNNKWSGKRKSQPYIAPITKSFKKQERLEEYLLVDGYNIIYAWENLRELAKVSIDGARGKLLDILCNYQAVKKCSLIVVFDAYRVQGHRTETMDYHNIHVVFTKEAETADQYIEKFAHDNRGRYDVTVATSDGLEQIIIRGQGCALLSAKDLQAAVDEVSAKLREEYIEEQKPGKNYPLKDALREVKEEIQE